MILQAFSRTFRSLLNLKVILILLVPFLVSTFILGLILFFTWGYWTGFLHETAAVQWMLSNINALAVETLFFIICIIGAILIFGPLWYLVYVLILSLLLFPLLLPHVQKTFYPNLEMKKGGHLAGSVQNVLLASFVYCLGYFVTMPVLIFTPFSPVISLMLTAYLNKKVFTYDVWQDFASTEERKAILRFRSSELWILGILTAFLTWIPMVNIIAPAITSLSFIHYCLEALDHHRRHEPLTKL